MSNNTSHDFRRVNVLIREDQYERISDKGLNMSGLIRGLLDDHFSDAKVVLSLSPDARQVYEHVISNFGVSDAVLEPYVLKALDAFLADKSKDFDRLRSSIRT